jgi:signal transduction histidine kinase
MRQRDLIAVDTAVGILVSVLALFTGLLRHHQAVVEMPLGLDLAVLLALGAGIGLRRRYPWSALWAVSIAAPVSSLQSESFPFAAPPAMMLVLYTLATVLPRRRAARALGVMLGCAVGVLAALWAVYQQVSQPPTFHHDFRTEVFGTVVMFVPLTGVWMIGVAVGASRTYAAGLQAQAEQRAREQVAEERLRIARELHDIVAHSMSLITMQASVASYIGAEQPHEAVKALASIEQTSRTALHDMRRLLGMLRDSDGRPQDPDLMPAPGLSDLDDLVARTAEAGIRVELRITGEPAETSTPLELAAYRIVQEALTNVIKHADATRARVVLDYGRDDIGIVVVDDGHGLPGTHPAPDAPATASGHGLVGMHERVAAYGGHFDAGPVPGGGFRVSARIPLEAPA